jgi:hypothetical protein
MRLILKKGDGRQGLPCPEVRNPFVKGLESYSAQGTVLAPSDCPLKPLTLISLEHIRPASQRQTKLSGAAAD